VELDLRPGSADGTLEGTRKAHVANTRQIFYGDAASTTAEVHGEYDDLTQSVRLIAEAHDVTRFVFDAETNTLAGCLDRQAEQFSPEAKALLDHSIEKEKTRYCYAAIHDLDELTKMEPNNAALYYRKANLYLMDHASEQANENFKKASQLEPTNLQYGLRASHPVPPSHQLTAEQMMDNLITGAAVVGTAIVGGALLADKMAIDDSKRIVAESGGKKKLCPVCKGRKSLMVIDTPPPAMNPHRWGTQEYELFELQQKNKTTMRTADCDECHGTGVVDN